MKKIKRLLSMALSLAFISTITGCSQGTKTSDMGRYLEERYEGPKDVYIQNMVSLEEEKIGMTAYSDDGKIRAFTSDDGGKTWDEKAVDLPKEEGKETIVNISTFLSNGNIFVSYYHMEPMKEEPATLEENSVEGESTEAGVSDEVFYKDDYFENIEYKYAVVDGDGKINDIEIDLSTYINEDDMNYGYSMMEQVKSTLDGDLLFSLGNKVVQLDSETFEEKNIYEATDYINNYFVVGDSLVINEFDSIIEYDVNTGKEKGNLEALEKETVENQTNYYPTFIDSGSKDKIYYYSVLGLYVYDMNTEKCSQLVDGAISSFGDRDMNLMSFMEKSNGDFLVAFNDWMNNEVAVINYHYDETVPSVPDKQLRVYSLLENDSIRQAVSSYAKLNPDTYVKYEIGLTWGEGVTETDALKTLNTEIMAGNGPDIIVLDGLSAESYIEKGLLEDISDVIKPYSEDDSVFKNIVDAYTVDGKIYQFPTRFKFPILIGQKDNINKVTDLDSLVNLTKELGEVSDKRIFGDYYSPRGLVYSLYYLYGNNWINDNDTINEDELSTFFTAAKEMYTAIDKNYQKYMDKMNEVYADKENINNGIIIDKEEVIEDDIETDEEYKDEYEDINNVYEMSYYLCPSVYADSFLYEDGISLMYGGIDSSYGFSSLITAINGVENLDYKILTRGDESIFVPSEIIGINAKSGNKEAAKELIKGLFAEKDKDKMMWGQGITVNKKNFAKEFELEKNEYYTPEFDEASGHYITGSSFYQGPDGVEKEIKQLWPNEADINRLMGEIESLNVGATVNNVLLTEVAKQFEAFVTDEISLEDAIKTVVDNLDLYLSE